MTQPLTDSSNRKPAPIDKLSPLKYMLLHLSVQASHMVLCARAGGLYLFNKLFHAALAHILSKGK